LITQRIENAVDQDGELHDPRIARLVARDRPGASTLLRYLDTGSDVSRVAAELDIHPTTVRYRLRRLAQALELDLTDADDRLSVQVQLRCELHRGA
jgi:DNA-binding PucR family transcriptional regulator